MCNKLAVGRARRKFLKAVRDANEGKIPLDLPLPGRSGKVYGETDSKRNLVLADYGEDSRKQVSEGTDEG